MYAQQKTVFLCRGRIFAKIMSVTTIAKEEKLRIVKFAPKGKESFYDAVKREVEAYFKDRNIAKHGNLKMYVKTIAMLAMYFVPYGLIVGGIGSSSMALFYLSWVVMGVGIAGVGCSVMHDSNHGSYSPYKGLNTVMGASLNILGGYARNWVIQHNILHHTYTNLKGLDEDIEAGDLIRMSPHSKWRPMHKYQHWYAWLLYGIMNIYWVIAKDYLTIFRYHKNGLLKKQKITLTRAFVELTIYKVIYFGYIIVLPLLFAQVAWYHVVLGFVAMQLMGGFLLAIIFQVAHVMEESEFPEMPIDRKMENSWAIHQVLNTVNFSPRSPLVTWFVGGLNYQIEHHLFPQICHVHYPDLSDIVKAKAKEYNIPYSVQPTFLSALREHKNMLKKLGTGYTGK